MVGPYVEELRLDERVDLGKVLAQLVAKRFRLPYLVNIRNVILSVGSFALLTFDR